jgi:hypothetical protein
MQGSKDVEAGMQGDATGKSSHKSWRKSRRDHITKRRSTKWVGVATVVLLLVFIISTRRRMNWVSDYVTPFGNAGRERDGGVAVVGVYYIGVYYIHPKAHKLGQPPCGLGLPQVRLEEEEGRRRREGDR